MVKFQLRYPEKALSGSPRELRDQLIQLLKKKLPEDCSGLFKDSGILVLTHGIQEGRTPWTPEALGCLMNQLYKGLEQGKSPCIGTLQEYMTREGHVLGSKFAVRNRIQKLKKDLKTLPEEDLLNKYPGYLLGTRGPLLDSLFQNWNRHALP